VTQYLSHYLDGVNADGSGGRHLAVDVSPYGGGDNAIGAPVYAVGDGEVVYAGPNGSTYKNVVLIRHELGDGTVVCSFYGHITTPLVQEGDQVSRGQQISTVISWTEATSRWPNPGPSSNSHLHYVFLSEDLCNLSASANGMDVCGYDRGGPNGVDAQGDEPARYTSAGDECGDQGYPGSFISPTQFIAAHKAAP
jgi:murein DD-endopeptidase MepM/ murein hydrolase activator NlpD